MYLIIRRTTIIRAAVIILATALLFYPLSIIIEALSAETGPEFAIIMYHHISPKKSIWNDFVISDRQFESDLKYLRDRGYESITITQLIKHLDCGEPLPEKPVMITFDDGFESLYSYALPLLKEYGMTAVVSVVGKYADDFTQNSDHNLNYSHLTWVQIYELQKSGIIEIQNHTYDLHYNTSRRRKGSKKVPGESNEHYRELLTADLTKLQHKIHDYTGWTPNTFAYPFGFISPESVDIIKSLGFRATLTCRSKKVRVRYDSSDWLYSLGRFNRPHGPSSAEFFKKVL